jgi:hypothetical protein
MIILQIDSLTTNTSFIDNFFWPLVLTIVVGLGVLIWNYILRKTFKIKINSTDTFVGQHNGQSYLIINVSLINKTQDPINGLTLTTNNPLLTVRNGVSTMTASGRLQGGGMLLPTVVNLVRNVILNVPLTINPITTVDGNIVIDFNVPLVNEVELTFSYLDKRIVKSINTSNLQRRNL